MRKKNYRGTKCIKRELKKCEDICKTYDKIQTVYTDLLEDDDGIISFRCNVLLEGVADDMYTTDIVAVKTDGSLLVRECVWRKNLTRPTTARLLDISRNYWLSKGVGDWGLVIDKEPADESK